MQTSDVVLFEHGSEIYDIVFLLGALSQVVGPDSSLYPSQIPCAGVISLAFLSLGSLCPGVRAPGYHILHRYYTSLTQSVNFKLTSIFYCYNNIIVITIVIIITSFNFLLMLWDWIRWRRKDDQIWSHLVQKLRRSVCGNGNVRLNGPLTVFLARAALVMSDPQHALYQPMHKYILVKPQFTLNTVPAFLEFFHSSDAVNGK